MNETGPIDKYEQTMRKLYKKVHINLEETVQGLVRSILNYDQINLQLTGDLPKQLLDAHLLEQSTNIRKSEFPGEEYMMHYDLINRFKHPPDSPFGPDSSIEYNCVGIIGFDKNFSFICLDQRLPIKKTTYRGHYG